MRLLTRSSRIWRCSGLSDVWRWLWWCRRRRSCRSWPALSVRKDRVNQHASMRVNQSLNLDVGVILWIDLVDRSHPIYVRADLPMNLEMLRRSLVQPKGCHNIPFTNGFMAKARLGNFEPKKNFEHDGEVNDVPHQTSEDARSIRNKSEQDYKQKVDAYVLWYISESHLTNVTDRLVVAVTGERGPDIGVTTSKAALMDLCPVFLEFTWVTVTKDLRHGLHVRSWTRTIIIR